MPYLFCPFPVLNIDYTRCDKKSSCKIPVDSSIFGDPCPGTNKYVEVHYTCQPEHLDATPPVTSKALPPWLLDLAATPTASVETDQPTVSITTNTSTEQMNQMSPSTTLNAITKTEIFTEDLGHLNEEIFDDKEHYCHPTTSRTLFWNWTLLGEEAIQICPQGSTGFARWACGMDGSWSSDMPNFGECHSQWLTRVDFKATLGEASIPEIASEMVSSTQTKSLYGSDLLIIAKVMQSISHKVRQELFSMSLARKREKLTSEVNKAALKIASNVLEPVQRIAWKDLDERKRASSFTSLLIGLEENAILLAEALNDEKILLETTNHILSSVIVLSSRDVNDFIFHSTQETNGQIIIPMNTLLKNSINGAIRLIFYSFGNIGELFLNNNSLKILNSNIVGVISPTMRFMDVTETPVKVILKHFEKSGHFSSQVCAVWNYNDKVWSENECSIVDTNSTHLTCNCRRFGHYAIIAAEANNEDPTTQHHPQLGLIDNGQSFKRTSIIIAISFSLGIFLILTTVGVYKIESVRLYFEKVLPSKNIFCNECKKNEGGVNPLNDLFPPFPSSPTSIDTGVTSACSSDFFDQFLDHQVEKVSHQKRGLNRGSVYHVTGPRPQPGEVCGSTSPYKHHIYMEIDPVYNHINAESYSESHSDFQLSDLSEDEFKRSRASFNRYFEERPLIRSNMFLQSLTRSSNLNRESLTNHSSSQVEQQQSTPFVVPLPLNSSSFRPLHFQHQRPIPLQQHFYQHPLRSLDTPITIALQGGEQFVRLKIAEDRSRDPTTIFSRETFCVK